MALGRDLTNALKYFRPQKELYRLQGLQEFAFENVEAAADDQVVQSIPK